tara:strand:+ start:702 stop:857 length:156 start_codon:yes stop_codon:yes gene_type:complete
MSYNRNVLMDETTLQMLNQLAQKHSKRPEVFLDEIMTKIFFDWKKTGKKVL